eukprot:5360313-Amphidinium_carterae.2
MGGNGKAFQRAVSSSTSQIEGQVQLWTMGNFARNYLYIQWQAVDTEHRLQLHVRHDGFCAQNSANSD